MAQAEVGSLRVTLGMNAGDFDRKTKKAGRSMDMLAKKAAQLAGAMAGAFITVGMTSVLSKAIRLWGIQEKAIASVEATLRTTGGTVGFTSKQLQDMASELQNVSVFGDEEILQKVTNNLLTFGNVVGPVFKRAQSAALNLSAVLGQDLQSSSIQLGKALNDPILGITALSRVGIAFTQEQKDMIKTLVQSGQTMKAQGVILSEIEKFYGQAAKAARETSQGAIKAASNDIGDAFEAIGKDLAPIVVKVAGFVSDIAKAFQALTPETRKFSTAVVALGGTLTAVTAALSFFGVSLGVALGPLTLIIGSIAAVGAALYAFWPQVVQTAKIIDTMFANIYNAAKTYLYDAIKPILDNLGKMFLWAWEKIKAYFVEPILGISKVVDDGFMSFYNSAKKWLVDAFKPILEWINWFIKKVAELFYEIGEITGFNEIAVKMGTEVKKGFDFTVREVETGVTKLKEVWVKGSEDVATVMNEAVTKWKEPVISVKQTYTDAEKEIIASQNRLIEEGVRLTENLRTPYDIMIEKVKALQAAQAAGKITANQYKDAQLQAAMISANGYASMASDIMGTLSGIFEDSKGFAIASAIINTLEAVTKAMTAYPPPYSYAAAGAALAAGMAQVSKIKSTSKSSKSTSAGSTGGGAASGSIGQSGGDTGQGGATQSLLVQGVNPDDLFTGESVRQLAGKLLEYQRDGGKVVFQ